MLKFSRYEELNRGSTTGFSDPGGKTYVAII